MADRIGARLGRSLVALALLALAERPMRSIPDHAIKAVVPFPPGGGTDIFARLVSQRLAQVLGQPVVVENKGGADGNIGMEYAAKSAADGYTILFNSSAATVNPVMYRNLRFDPAQELRPSACWRVLQPRHRQSGQGGRRRRCRVHRAHAAQSGQVQLRLQRRAPRHRALQAGDRRHVEIINYRGAGDAITACCAATPTS
jgi:hypothetical protein